METIVLDFQAKTANRIKNDRENIKTINLEFFFEWIQRTDEMHKTFKYSNEFLLFLKSKVLTS